MDLAISCSLEGRDLAIVKSIININNIYGDLSLTYVDDIANSQVLIAKQNINGKETYFAEDRKLQKKYEIKTTLNPKTVRAMFEFLGNAIEVKSLELKTHSTEIISIHQSILQHAENNKEQLLHILHQDFSILVDEQSQKVSTSIELTDKLLKSISNNSITEVQYEYIPQAIIDHYKFEISLSTFKWNLGYFKEHSLINNHYKSNNSIFRLLSWPNFGSYRFDQEFIRLSSLLWKQPENYDHLLNLSGYEEHIVNKFLNATLMSGMVDAETSEIKQKPSQKPKDNYFIQSLKSFFGFK